MQAGEVVGERAHQAHRVLAFAEQPLEAALERSRLAERRRVYEIVEPERGAVAKHGRDVLQSPGVAATPAAPSLR